MSRNIELTKQIEDAVASLARDLEAADSVIVRIPGWQPTGREEGLHWMRSSLAEGFYVASRVTWSEREATVWMKLWECGEPEPEWSS